MASMSILSRTVATCSRETIRTGGIVGGCGWLWAVGELEEKEKEREKERKRQNDDADV